MTKHSKKAASRGPLPSLREPTEGERASISLARAEKARRETGRINAPSFQRLERSPGVCSMANPHTDYDGWSAQVDAVLGTNSRPFADALTTQLANVTGEAGDPEKVEAALNRGMAFMAGVQPRDEVEAALGAQMFATHELSMEMARRARVSQTVEGMEAYGRLMTKTQRTFTAQVEALAKLRSGGKQQVEVRYVYVDARGGQNIIATGGGAEFGNGGQPQAPAQLADASASSRLPVWGADTLGHALHGAGDPRPEALQDARRQEPGRSQRASERGVEDGAAHERDALAA